MPLWEQYDEIAALWRWAARAFVERAAKADCYHVDAKNRETWLTAAVSASRRAARYGRLAHNSKALSD